MSARIEAPKVLELITRHVRGALADIGCGKVPYHAVCRPLVENIVCIGWSGSWHGTRYVDQEADLNLGIPLPDAACYTILATSVVEHLRDSVRFFGKAARVLRLEGKLVLSVPLLCWLREEPSDFCR